MQDTSSETTGSKTDEQKELEGQESTEELTPQPDDSSPTSGDDVPETPPEPSDEVTPTPPDEVDEEPGEEDEDDLTVEEYDDKEEELDDSDEEDEPEEPTSDTEKKGKKKKKKGKRGEEEEELPPNLLSHLNIEKMSLEELRSEIRQREKKRKDILDQLKEINRERNQFRERRNDYNKEAMEAFQKVSELKSKRDDTNKKIRELKQMRESVLQELKQLSNREREIVETMKKADESRGRVNSRRINKEIERLEWKLQTTAGVTLDEERSIMERIDELNALLGEARTVESVQKELRDIRKRKGTLKAYLDDSWKQMNELVSASQSRHQRLSELYETGKKAKQEADHNHQLFIQKIEMANDLRKQLRRIGAELDLLYPRYKGLQEEKKKKDSSKRAERQTEIREVKTKEIQRKLSSKKGLSMEEMKFLMENKLISLNEDEKDDE